jgi:hypothetical protein
MNCPGFLWLCSGFGCETQVWVLFHSVFFRILLIPPFESSDSHPSQLTLFLDGFH